MSTSRMAGASRQAAVLATIGGIHIGAFVLADPGLLTGYHEAVHALTSSVLDGMSDRELDRVVDDRWDPPVTLGVRLVSVVNDDQQHVGQAAFIRGLIMP